MTKLKLSHNEVINKTTFVDESFIPPTPYFWDSVDDDNANEVPIENDNTTPLNRRFREQARFTFATILDIIQGAIGGFMNYETFVNSEDTNEEEDETTPTIAGVARQLARKHNKTLDKKQYITYEIICTIIAIVYVTIKLYTLVYSTGIYGISRSSIKCRILNIVWLVS